MIDQILAKLDDEAKEVLYNDVEFIKKDKIPNTIYLEAYKWIEIPKICVVFIDMVNSSQIDYRLHRPTSAKIYETFTKKRRKAPTFRYGDIRRSCII